MGAGMVRVIAPGNKVGRGQRAGNQTRPGTLPRARSFYRECFLGYFTGSIWILPFVTVTIASIPAWRSCELTASVIAASLIVSEFGTSTFADLPLAVTSNVSVVAPFTFFF